ncbi:MAG TPA: DUF5985 family protein [Gemmatimonadaceae bacterium]
MNHVALLGVLNGLLACAAAVAALLFFKSYARTRDRLFAQFGTAFVLLAVERLIIPLAVFGAEHQWWVYGVRLIAFAIIIVAIADKNRAATP